MSLFPFMDNILWILNSPETATMGSTFGIGDELRIMKEALEDVQHTLLEPIKEALGGAEYLPRGLDLCKSLYWKELTDTVIRAGTLLDELSTELAMRQDTDGVQEKKLLRTLSIIFSRWNRMLFSRKLKDKIKQIVQKIKAYPYQLGQLSYNRELYRRPASLAATLDGRTRAFFDLPLHLKHCFAYCLLFPEGYAIYKSTIIQLWIAQGLILAADMNNRSLEEVGCAYFMDIHRRSLFSEIQEDEFGNILSFKVHILISSPANRLDVIDFDYSHLVHHLGNNHFSSDLWKFGSQGSGDPYMIHFAYRMTILMPHQPPLVNLIDNARYYDSWFKASHGLRVLDLHHTSLRNVPSSIDKLKHLRYLDLSENAFMEVLPRCITQLRNLLTLKLSYCQRLKELPDDIARLVNLRHLEIDGCRSLANMPCGIGRLKHLCLLSTFVVSKNRDESASSKKAGISELAGLNNLQGGLTLRGLENVRGAEDEVKATNMKEKKIVERLSLVWKAKEDVSEDYDRVQSYPEDELTLEYLEPNLNLKGLCIDGYDGVKFPAWLSSPLHLVKIKLSNCCRCRHLPPLDQLFHLKFLTLENLSAVEYIIGNEIDSSFRRPHYAAYFPSLEQLCLRELPKLKGWFEDDMIRGWEYCKHEKNPLPTSFSVLSVVTVENCPKLSMPLLSSVRSLHLNKMDKIQLPCFLQVWLPWVSASHSKNYEASSSSSSPSSDTLRANLKSLHISHMRDLDKLPDMYFSDLSALEELEIQYCPSLLGLPSLKNLKCLTILGCQRLVSLSGWITHLTALESLKLHRCPELDLTQYPSKRECPEIDLTSYPSQSNMEDVYLRWWPEFEMSMCRDSLEPELHSSSLSNSPGNEVWGNLHRLTSLEIVEIPKLTCLPEELQLVTSLQKLELIACTGLKELPEWMSKLQSLRHLILTSCPELETLPKGLADLRNLSELKIIGCPLLTQRYHKQTGADRAVIAHVPHVEVA
ncbi:hypothetical protein SAY86_031054 [Trapa natans]|uniref:Uncharacterized protein n=1 Tax=Trapa natans TaxID=22666 RepID=A0AAN7MTK8_TRANT|nr:hypothetical protein SAY86_031054 [Trapa natans]